MTGICTRLVTTEILYRSSLGSIRFLGPAPGAFAAGILPAGTVCTGGMGGGAGFACSPCWEELDEGWSASGVWPGCADVSGAGVGFGGGGCTVEGVSGMSCGDWVPAGDWP